MAVCVAICGSMSFVDEMVAIATSLKSLGYEVFTPDLEEQDYDWSNLKDPELIKVKRAYIDRHLENIRHSDVVLIANFPKRGIIGYVGPNTLMEAAFAHAVGAPIIFLNDPSEQSGGIECVAISSGCLDGDVAGITKLLDDRSDA